MSSCSPWIVTTCMGRLEHLAQTLPAALRNADCGVVLVDFSCPQASGEWATQTFHDAVMRGQLQVIRVLRRSSFHKTVALNIGAHAAISGGASHLCFVDADTHLLPGFGKYLRHALEDANDSSRMLIASLTDAGREVAELYGLLVVSSDLFQEAGGYSEDFVGWGCEDLEMRLRLVLKHRATLGEVPLNYLAYIQHAFELRSKNYETKDWTISNSNNLVTLNQLVLAWTGKSLPELDGAARRLIMQRHPTLYENGAEIQHFAPLPGLNQP